MGATMPAGADRPASFIGRDKELGLLLSALGASSPARVVFLNGIAGIGKSTLLGAWAGEAEQRGTRVLRIDARVVEPTDVGFLGALGSGAGVDLTDWPTAREALASRSTVIAIDNAEVIRLLDTWLRQRFVPSLPEGVRLVVSGREPPVAAWFTAEALDGRVIVLPLDRLPEPESRALLERLGVPAGRTPELARLTHGHPLAIRLTAATLAQQPDLSIEDLASHRLVDDLARLFLAEVRDPGTRSALYAGSVVRRLTLSLLRAMAPEVVQEDFDRLADVAFVESRHDGLVIHEAVRDPIARHLQATDPSRYRQFRRAAWRRLSDELSSAPVADLWRYTADMLYLIENPVVREAFFPGEAQPLAVEPAPADALSAIEAITLRHDGPAASRLVRAWWARAPESFSVVRDRDGDIVAWFQLFDTPLFGPRGVMEDPVVEGWRRHLREAPVSRGEQVLGFRRWLGIDQGEAPCGSQAASWLDVTRTYMAMRPHLRRIYTVVRDAPTYWPVVEGLGFRKLPERDGVAMLDGKAYTSVVLDFGPRSVDGWLAGLVAAELGLRPWVLDAAGHELCVDGGCVNLTPLEFGVLDKLCRVPGRTVTRRELLEDVWGWPSSGGSNVVDAVIRRLRKKLHDRPAIETVRARGYRLREDWHVGEAA